MCSRNSAGSPEALLDVEQRLQPLVRALLGFADFGVGALVQPVRGDAGLGDAVHRLGADLDLDGHAVGADQGRVQRLISVHLGNGDVVLELPGYGLVQPMQRTQGEVAGGYVLDDDPKAVDVEHLREREVLFVHLVVDRKDVLLAAGYRGLDSGRGQALLERLEDLVHHRAPVAAGRLDGFREDLVAERIEVRERELLQLAVEAVQAQPVGDRGVDLDRLARDAPARLRVDRLERPHVVQPVGELDQDDAHVARHREQHLAEVLGLGVGLGLELDAVELGQAVHEFRDGLAEALGDLLLGDLGVLHHVVQQRRHHRLGVELPVGDDLGDRDRVRDVGMAALAELPLVRGAR